MLADATSAAVPALAPYTLVLADAAAAAVLALAPPSLVLAHVGEDIIEEKLRRAGLCSC